MLTINQENYCQARHRGLTQRAAYREAYPRSRNWKDKSVDEKASTLEKNVKVSSRLNQLQRESAKAATLDKAKLISTLDSLFKGNATVAANAIKAGGANQAANSFALNAYDRLMVEAEKAEAIDSAPFAADFALLIQPDFFAAHRVIASGTESDIWFQGGRGSCKSSDCSLELVNYLQQHPMEHGVVLMKYAVNLRQGAVSQVEWACDQLGVSDQWESTKSPLELTNVKTGQKIFFRGCDDPKKLKSSIKPPFGHVGIVWYEEADLFRGHAEIRSVNQTLSRGGKTLRLYSYNPPRSKHSWINEHVQKLKDEGKPVFMSNYLNVPREWLGETFFEDAEWLKQNDHQAYLHEYMGQPVGNGTDVFDRVEFRVITDEEIASFDNPRIGQDFGWYPDPWAFTVSEWRQSGRTLLTWYEDGGNKLQPNEQAERILQAFERIRQQHGYALNGVQVLSDDAAPQDIAAHKAFGVNARKANKGGMREASYKFLQSAKWVIDPNRCPHLAAEVRAMEYEVNKEGEVLNTIPDGNDHWIDATRYAIMRDAARGRTAYAG